MASNNSDVNSDVGEKHWFTAEELAELRLPGYPRTGRRMHDRAKAEGWECRQVDSSGRTGSRTEYSPPPSVKALIGAHQPGGTSSAPVGKKETERAIYTLTGLKAQEPSDPHGEIDGAILQHCLQACSTMHGDEFVKLNSSKQLEYAVDLYNLLVRMCHGQGKSFGTVKRLEVNGLVEQLGAFIKLGWAKRFPPLEPPFNCFF